MRWQREDAAYAAATLVAAALVVYFVVANFGLLPSPFAPAGVEQGRSVSVPSLSSLPKLPTLREVPRTDTVEPAPSDALPAAPAPTVDDSAPSVAFTTPSGTEVSVTEPATVEGTAGDIGSGINMVKVSYESDGTAQSVDAHVTCTGPSRTRCTWEATVPDVAGTYTVTATATDRVLNSRTSEPIEFTVVDSGSAVDAVTGLVEDVVGGLLGR